MSDMVDIRMDGLDKVKKDFKDMKARMENPSVCMDVLGAKGFKNVDQHFGAEEGPLLPWKQLKHPRRSGGGGILKDTGRLRNSTRFRTINRNEAHVYNNCEYAAVHNFGATIKTSSKFGGGASGYKTYYIPQRKFMWIDQKTQDSMRKSMIRWIMEGKAL